MIDSIIAKIEQLITAKYSNLVNLASIPSVQLVKPSDGSEKVNINIAVGNIDTQSGETGNGMTPQNISFKINCIPYTAETSLDMSKLAHEIIPLLYNCSLGLNDVEPSTSFKSVEVNAPGETYKYREISADYLVYTGAGFIDPGVPVTETYWSQSPEIGAANVGKYQKMGN